MLFMVKLGVAVVPPAYFEDRVFKVCASFSQVTELAVGYALTSHEIFNCWLPSEIVTFVRFTFTSGAAYNRETKIDIEL